MSDRGRALLWRRVRAGRRHTAGRLGALLFLPLALALAALAMVAASPEGRAQGPEPAVRPAGSAGPDGGLADAEPAEGATADGGASDEPRVRELLERAARIGALLDGALELGVDPRSLFDVDVDDELAVELEARRVRLLVDAADARARDHDAGADAADGGPAGKRGLRPAPRPVAGAGDAGDAGAGPTDAEPASQPELLLSEELWRAQLALDRSRLSFYERSPEDRRALLEAHAERVRANKEAEQQQQILEAERRARAAAAERDKALAAMRGADTEAARLVAEERARLLGVEQEQASFEKQLIVLEHGLDAGREALLSWRRRLAALGERPEQAERPGAQRADQAYDELRQQLRADRQALGEALTALERALSAVPAAGPDPLGELLAGGERKELAELRARVQQTERALRERESSYRAAHATLLMEQVTTLNQQRLALLPRLSSPKRDALVGFGAVGRDQARAEVHQVGLVLRFQQWATLRWLAEGWRRREPGSPPFGLTPLALAWLVPVFAFGWWRRRAPGLMNSWSVGAQEAHERRTRSKSPSRLGRAIDFVGRLRGPVEWLLLLGIAGLLLPQAARERLELQLIGETLAWSLGAVLVIRVIDALSSRRPSLPGKTNTAALRLRSLRLVGLVVVLFTLVLRVAVRLVGRGTIYAWILQTCWLAAIPVALVLVGWWQGIVYERLGARRRKSSLAAWAGTREQGWGRYPVAVIGAGYLLLSGLSRQFRRWVSGFDLTRRALAYWFHREVARQAAAGPEKAELGPPPAGVNAALDPDTPSQQPIESVADQDVQRIVELVRRRGGGLFAVVGERGAGKSTLLRRIAGEAPDVRYVQCPHGGLAALRARLAEGVGLAREATFEQIGQRLDPGESDQGIVVDDVHRLMRPEVGGLDELDALLTVARRASTSCTWVLAVDVVIWQLFERGRGSRPAFDDVIALLPWSEEAVSRLLSARSEAAGLEPSYELVVPPLPSTADELDREEARARAHARYVRLIWDHAGGNPGVALQLWRDSLRAGAGQRLLVRLFATPSPAELDTLPDELVFVLRAVLQLDQARAEDVASATMLSAAEVASALRYGAARGYLEPIEGRLRIAWPWFRPITRFLERRHLLVTVRPQP